MASGEKRQWRVRASEKKAKEMGRQEEEAPQGRVKEPTEVGEGHREGRTKAGGFAPVPCPDPHRAEPTQRPLHSLGLRSDRGTTRGGDTEASLCPERPLSSVTWKSSPNRTARLSSPKG